jgi:hypothetical protein
MVVTMLQLWIRLLKLSLMDVLKFMVQPWILVELMFEEVLFIKLIMETTMLCFCSAVAGHPQFTIMLLKLLFIPVLSHWTSRMAVGLNANASSTSIW